MKRPMLTTLTLAALVSGCVPGAGVIAIDKFFPLANTCGFPDDVDVVLQGAGSLNVAIFRPEFWIGMRVRGLPLTQNAIGTATTVLEPENRDVPTITGVLLSYRVSRSGRDVTPAALKNKRFTYPLLAPLDSDFLLTASINLITPEAAEVLPGLDTADELVDGFDMLVGVEVIGKLNRTFTPITSGQLDFPIKVLNTSPTACTKPQRLFSSCFFAGQSAYQVKPATPRCCDQLPQNPVPIGCDYTP